MAMRHIIEKKREAKHMRDHIISDPDCYSSVEQLAAEHQMSVSQLQKVFQSIYGVPVYKYLREYRLEQAAVALQKTEKSITEIALTAGFSNPGKFSETFTLSYIVFAFGFIGDFLPIWVTKTSYLQSMLDGGMDASYVQQLERLISGPVIALVICSILLGAVIGSLLGNKLMKKHFIKAGIA